MQAGVRVFSLQREDGAVELVRVGAANGWNNSRSGNFPGDLCRGGQEARGQNRDGCI